MTNELYASQEGAAVMPNGMRYFHFYSQVAPGRHDMITKTIKDGDGFPTLQEALAHNMIVNKSIGNETEEILIQKLKKWVNTDFGKGLGEVFPEYKLVAWVGTHNTQKPVVYYTYNGIRKWVTHPQIQLMVQRYGVYYGS